MLYHVRLYRLRKPGWVYLFLALLAKISAMPEIDA